MSNLNETSRTEHCENCGAPTSFERTDPATQPPEGEVCDRCKFWLCPDCSHSPDEKCPPVLSLWENKADSSTGDTAEDEWEVFGPNFILFPDSGIEVDCAIVTETKDGQAQEIAAVYGLSKDDYWQTAAQIVKEHNAHRKLVEALRGVAIMLNAELLKYQHEPWAIAVRAALAEVDK